MMEKGKMKSPVKVWHEQLFLHNGKCRLLWDSEYFTVWKLESTTPAGIRNEGCCQALGDFSHGCICVVLF